MKTTEFLKENATIAQESPEDTGMVINNLHTIMRVTADLAKRLQGDENLDEWIKEKIAVAKSMMVTVEDYIASQQEMGGDEVPGCVSSWRCRPRLRAHRRRASRGTGRARPARARRRTRGAGR